MIFSDQVEKKADDNFDLVMDIKKLHDWHFSENLEVVVESAGNHVTEQKVSLQQIFGR